MSVPKEISDRLSRVKDLLPGKVLDHLRFMDVEKLLYLLSISQESSAEARDLAEARVLSSCLFLGEIKSEARRAVEANSVVDAFMEYQLYDLKCQKVSELIDCLLSSRRKKRKGKPVICFLSEVSDDS